MFGGPTTNPWAVNWRLTQRSKAGGWIVQHMIIRRAARPDVEYWEAWHVSGNSNITDLAYYSLTPFDDRFRIQQGAGEMFSSARFYEGLSLPDSFKVRSDSPAGILRMTSQNPRLSIKTATAPNRRYWVIR